MSVAQTLYRSIYESFLSLHSHLNGKRSIYNAIRSGILTPNPSLQSKWTREHDFLAALSESKHISIARYLRSMMRDQNSYENAFATLRCLGNHISILNHLQIQKEFEPKKRWEDMRFRVGDVVRYDDKSHGVICGWSIAKRFRTSPRIVYHLLLSDARMKVSTAAQDTLQQLEPEIASPVRHPWTLFFFDGFENGRHLSCDPLRELYPDDHSFDTIAAKETAAVSIDSIVELQFAHENQLIQYLQCSDISTAQYVTAILEGKWLGEYGSDIQQQLLYANQQSDLGDIQTARNMLKQITRQYPEYAFAWSKLGLLEVRDGNYKRAIRHYQRATKIKPHMIDAWLGIATCAAKLDFWNLTHQTALKVLKLQPNNETAQRLKTTALFEALGGSKKNSAVSE